MRIDRIPPPNQLPATLVCTPFAILFTVTFLPVTTRPGYLVHDPGEVIHPPKKPKRLPKVILSANEVQKLMAAADTRTNRGWRNRIILEILYDTAIRRSEMAGFKVNDLDLNAGFVHIRGKGDKDRVVPVSARVCRLVETYILMVRPAMLHGKDTGHLMLNRWGHNMDPNSVWAAVKRCAQLSGIGKNVTTHTFRHTCATHMLKTAPRCATCKKCSVTNRWNRPRSIPV